MQNDFCIRAVEKPMTFLNQLLLQLGIIEDLSVESNPDRLRSITHRLFPAGEVDNAQPGVCQTNTIVHANSLLVWPAVIKGTNHSLEHKGIGRAAVPVNISSYSTHYFYTSISPDL